LLVTLCFSSLFFSSVAIHRTVFSFPSLRSPPARDIAPALAQFLTDFFVSVWVFPKKKERKKSRPVTPHPRTHALSVSVRILFLSCVRELVLTKKKKYRTGPDQVFDVLCTVVSLIAFSGWSPSRPKKKTKEKQE
jgi:hypothetical protein